MMHFDSEKYTSFNLLQSILVHFQPNSSFINNMFAYVRILICLVINAQKICSFVHLVQGKIDVWLIRVLPPPKPVFMKSQSILLSLLLYNYGNFNSSKKLQASPGKDIISQTLINILTLVIYITTCNPFPTSALQFVNTICFRNWSVVHRHDT